MCLAVNASSDRWQTLRDNTINLPNQRLYADWTASGRLYRPLEERLLDVAAPWMANTHSEASLSGRSMTAALEQAREQIRRGVGASNDDIVLFCGDGMTGAAAKLSRLLGLWVHERHRAALALPQDQQPVIYVTHMEHHSNQTLWLESLAEVRIIPPTTEGDVDLDWLADDLAALPTSRPRYASVTAASNVTGIAAPYRQIARLMHQQGGFCWVDFACAAPYVAIDMHPADDEPLDAVFFSPHKFLGGPGSSGVLVFNRALYANRIPDVAGGGTVVWTNPWGEHRFISDIERRESGGTPGILQGLKAGLAMQLKAEMGVAAMAEREVYLNDYFLAGLDDIPGVRLLANQHRQRLSVFSVVIEGVHYSQAVRRLSHDYGIEARGGCSCAGTYGHHLLGIDRQASRAFSERLEQGDMDARPGWVRLSFHPMNSTADLDRVLAALAELAGNPQQNAGPAVAELDRLWAPWF
ncbi:selenocysteine lyase [Saccharospirillum sp. MSK14-1]|uniref:aminotransferase class V-fold PLP-dependent enzyme n=1 Tax=Saccharospirillum sp. MSK14-1 TaxID=1897632 RepID=UPI000D3A9B6B|nr:aminotransferase class V-fold PLP-dependent enzyme [Saccharospirillum sp. MSK14-1]PTY35955.1 selenocysteine lyase [Saccharospirillum sp. MSK14-1]